MTDEKPNAVELAHQHRHPDYDEIAKRGLGGPAHDLSRVTEAFENSKGKCYGGIAAGGGKVGHAMTQRQINELIEGFTKNGVSREDVIRALQGSGYDVK
jgi:hypothetical protein